MHAPPNNGTGNLGGSGVQRQQETQFPTEHYKHINSVNILLSWGGNLTRSGSVCSCSPPPLSLSFFLPLTLSPPPFFPPLPPSLSPPLSHPLSRTPPHLLKTWSDARSCAPNFSPFRCLCPSASFPLPFSISLYPRSPNGTRTTGRENARLSAYQSRRWRQLVSLVKQVHFQVNAADD